MTPRVLAIALSATLFASLAAGEDTTGTTAPTKPDAPAAVAGPDVQDLVFLTEKRPLFLRLHIQVDGKAFESYWLEAMRRLHKYMDVDGDGKLSASERTRGSLLQRLQAGNQQAARPRPANAAAPPPRNADNVVTADDLAAYLRPTFGPMQLEFQASASASVPESLFAGLDADGDKRLTRAEVEAAEASLRTLDQDDDGTLQLQEMQPFRNPYFGRAMTRNQTAADNVAFALLSAHDSRTKVVRRLLARYDRPELDNRLSAEEVGMDPEEFERADGDVDGTLDTDELVRYLADVSPDLELDVKIGRGGTTKVEVAKTGPEPSWLARHVRDTPTGGLDLVLDSVQLELNSGGRAGIPDTRQFYQQQFRQADGDNNKYLELKEAQRTGVFDPATFKLMDRDGDGKLFEKEMNEYIAQDSDISESRTMLSALDQGRSLFDVLDGNRDRRLTVREVREVVAKMATWDRNGDGQVASDEIPRHYRLGFGRSRSLLMARFGFVDSVDNGMAYVGGRVATKAPAWFGKMDRNRDGDLSRREFLGTLADFRRLDADRNGLLDPGEAGAAK